MLRNHFFFFFTADGRGRDGDAAEIRRSRGGHTESKARGQQGFSECRRVRVSADTVETIKGNQEYILLLLKVHFFFKRLTM